MGNCLNNQEHDREISTLKREHNHLKESHKELVIHYNRTMSVINQHFNQIKTDSMMTNGHISYHAKYIPNLPATFSQSVMHSTVQIANPFEISLQ
jgi:ABC-type siderophore export system fused ATPase/permease subunit